MGPCPICYRAECLDPLLHTGMIETRRAVNAVLRPALDRAVVHALRPKGD